MLNISTLLGIMITVIIAVAVVMVTTNSIITPAITPIEVLNESHTPADALAKNYTFLTNHIENGISAINNVSNTTHIFGYVTSCVGVADLNYTASYPTGNITICGYNTTGNVFVDYTYKDDTYVDNGTVRTIYSTILTLLAGVIIVFVAFAIMRMR